MARLTPVYLEVGKKKVFASAVEWPGWARSGRDEAVALQALVDHGPRYARAIGRAADFSAPGDVGALEVTERLKGTITTDFGAPDVPPEADHRPVRPAQLEHLIAILEASWRALDRSVRTAGSRQLRLGPRGGGRDTARILEHVMGGERGYLSALGGRGPQATGADIGTDMAALRATILEVLRAVVRADPLADPSRSGKKWTPRYFVRRTAWHALDHAWEIEDRLEP